MATIPGVSNNELIRTTWGNSVATELNGNVVKKDATVGQSIAGPLTVAGTITANNQIVISDTPPTSGFHAARKDYVDNQIASEATQRVAVAGDTMTGTLNVGNIPTPSNDGIQIAANGAITTTVTTGSTTSLPNLVATRTGSGPQDEGGRFAEFKRSTALIGSITVAAGLAGINYNETSDYRLKNDLGPVVDAAARLAQLTPKHLSWKTDGTEFDGFIAHEVQAVVPYAVTGAKDAVLPADDPDDPGGIDAQQLDSGKIVPLLVAAVQELIARVAALEGATP